MNSLSFFAKNPSFRLNGKTSISSTAAGWLSVTLVTLSFAICYQSIDDLWAPYHQLDMKYAGVSGHKQTLSKFQVGIDSVTAGDITLSVGNQPIPPVQCEPYNQSVICFQIQSNSFQAPISYQVSSLSNYSNLALTIWQQDYQGQSKQFHLHLGSNQTVLVQLVKLLVLIDDSLFKLEPFTQLPSVVDVDISTSPSNSTAFTLVASPKDMQLYTFKRQKLETILGKFIACFNFLFFPTYFLLRSFHKTKFKCQASKQTINDPILNHLTLTSWKLSVIWFYSGCPYLLQKLLSGRICKELVYVSLVVLQSFEQSLSVDHLTQDIVQLAEDNIGAPVTQKDIRTYFSYKLMLHNDLDDQQQDQEQYQRQLLVVTHYFDKWDQRPFDYNTIWGLLNLFNMTSVPVQLDYHGGNLNVAASKKSHDLKTLDEEKCHSWKDGVFTLTLGLLVGCLFLISFVNQIVQRDSGTHSTQVYDTIFQNPRLNLDKFKLVVNQSVDIQLRLYINHQLETKKTPMCVEQNLTYTCEISQYISSKLDYSETLGVTITNSIPFVAQLILQTRVIFGYQTEDSQFSHSSTNGKLIYVDFQLLEEKSIDSETYILSPSLPNIRTGNNKQSILEFRLSLSQIGKVRKVVFNNFATVIKSVWTIVRIIIITFVADLVMNHRTRRDQQVHIQGQSTASTNSNNNNLLPRCQSSCDRQQENILDIVALLNFRNTKMRNRKSRHSLDLCSVVDKIQINHGRIQESFC